MLPDSIELIIVTPERQLLRESVAEVSLPGADGCLGILPGHAPLITELGIGEMTYQTKGGGESGPLAIMSGFAEVLGDRGASRGNRCVARGAGQETSGRTNRGSRKRSQCGLGPRGDRAAKVADPHSSIDETAERESFQGITCQAVMLFPSHSNRCEEKSWKL